MYTLARQQLLHTDVQTAWGFLENPHNLNDITPPELDFEIVSDAPNVMYNGLIIEYRITIPVIGKQRWVTEIKHIQEQKCFVDEQRIGPYRFWYHVHRLQQHEKGVLSSDTVYYVPPYAIIGKMLNAAFIAGTLRRIFDFRQQKLAELFNGE